MGANLNQPIKSLHVIITQYCTCGHFRYKLVWAKYQISSAETNSAIFEYLIVTVPFECLSTYTNYLGKYIIGPHVIYVFRNGEFK